MSSSVDASPMRTSMGTPTRSSPFLSRKKGFHSKERGEREREREMRKSSSSFGENSPLIRSRIGRHASKRGGGSGVYEREKREGRERGGERGERVLGEGVFSIPQYLIQWMLQDTSYHHGLFGIFEEASVRFFIFLFFFIFFYFFYFLFFYFLFFFFFIFFCF